jgi:hypothetical protein
LAEAGLRLYGLGYPILYEKSVLWGYSPLPNQTERRLKGSRVTIDPNGFRVAKPLGERNEILFFGDSIAYGGSYVDDEKIFSSVTCEILNDRIKESKYSCANAAVNAYGIRNMLSRIMYVEKQFPNAIIILTVISDDFYRNYSQLSGLPYFTTKLPEPFPATLELIVFSIDSARNWLRFRNSAGLGDVQNSISNMPSSRIEIDMVIYSLQEFMKRRKREGKHTALLWSPTKDWFNGIQDQDEQYPYDELKAMGINVVDMTAGLRESKRSHSDIFFDEAHLGEEGHRIYAQIISDILAKELEAN